MAKVDQRPLVGRVSGYPPMWQCPGNMPFMRRWPTLAIPLRICPPGIRDCRQSLILRHWWADPQQNGQSEPTPFGWQGIRIARPVAMSGHPALRGALVHFGHSVEDMSSSGSASPHFAQSVGICHMRAKFAAGRHIRNSCRPVRIRRLRWQPASGAIGNSMRPLGMRSAACDCWRASGT